MKHQSFQNGPVPSAVTPFTAPTVIGAGAWGTALAASLAEDGTAVKIWGRSAAVVDDITNNNRNSAFTGEAPLPPSLSGCYEMADALRGADVVLLVVPSGAIRAVARDMRPHLAPGTPIAVCAKGIEPETGLLMTQVVEEELSSHPVGCVSGPTFAKETVLHHPTAATVAFAFSPAERLDPARSVAARLAVSLSSQHFRAYISDDLVGVEIGGAVKNVIALACGMLTGAGFGDNTRAALITRGLDEMKALALALGGRRETLTGLSGLGDLTLTCNSPTSRNMSLGLQLGQGIAREDCFEGRPVVVEGEANTLSITDLARALGIEMPICEFVRAILHDGADLGQAFAALWARPIEAEPLAMDVAFAHPATDQDIATLAERIS
ncbi:NAD(P)H-dependent glycerol-3-phosphate dehydrogenase [Gymnodinialimonas ceratoperidinii]|uniref:Glycerol-3-phosphate dehydrogenase [NAD(P)+] n=1 Tax=Gymnodinialimonas ceratoperidinii TaxID=2856823 RepID=A0A8F6YDM4_9RHOB|nr:NAD(P)H-dependent glycerol-3-phosphate dehydrogenase [Gymnodinialimonas ceratoperidinii]QXT40630.1 NAD(P)-dependent glycerol-3-phosphate dehydrogenase [Gymnodinialimonas ceratoperidinii]